METIILPPMKRKLNNTIYFYKTINFNNVTFKIITLLKSYRDIVIIIITQKVISTWKHKKKLTKTK